MMVFLAILLTLFGSANGSLPGAGSGNPSGYDGMSGVPTATSQVSASAAPSRTSGPSDDGMSGLPSVTGIH
jgi:hypothetical protein